MRAASRTGARPRDVPRRLAAAALLLAAWAAGCGEERPAVPVDADAPAHLERLRLRPAPGAAPAPVEERLARFVPAEELERWSIVAPQQPLLRAVDRPLPGEPERLVLLRAANGEPPLALVRPGSYDTARFDQVRVRARMRGMGHLGVALRRDGHPRVESEKQLLPATDDTASFTFDLPTSSSTGVCDELVLVLPGGHRALGLVSVELVRRTPGSDLPDAAHAPDLVLGGSEWRRAVGLTPERPLEARFAVPEGARLELSLLESRGVRHHGARSTVRLELSATDAPDAPLLEREHRAGAEPAWDGEHLDLRAHAGRELVLRVSAAPDPGGDALAWAVGDAVLWVPSRARRSVLLVTSDTHRADHLGSAGLGVDIATPVLDDLAARGVVFLDAYSTTNVTNPSHIALFTGTHPRDTGILRNNLPLGGDATTLAQVFAEQGWRTLAALSAEHLAHPTSGLGRGFDRVSDPGGLVRDAEPSIDAVERWLDDAPGQPVFVWLHLFDAHWPYEPPGRFDRAYYPSGRDPFDEARHGPPPEPAPGQGFGPIRDMDFPRAQYRGEIGYLDEQLARLLERERFRAGVSAFVADHGESLGEQGMHFTHVPLTARELHVPLLLAWPEAPAGERVVAPVSHLDLGRTLLELAGADAGGFPGRSLLRAVGPSRARAEPRFALGANGHSAAVQEGDLLLVLQLSERTGAITAEKHAVELYELSTDRACEHDVAAQRPADAARLRRGLVAWLERAQARGWTGATIEDPELLAKLEELGYTQDAPEASVLWEPDGCAWCARFE